MISSPGASRAGNANASHSCLSHINPCLGRDPVLWNGESVLCGVDALVLLVKQCSLQDVPEWVFILMLFVVVGGVVVHVIYRILLRLVD